MNQRKHSNLMMMTLVNFYTSILKINFLFVLDLKSTQKATVETQSLEVFEAAFFGPLF